VAGHGVHPIYSPTDYGNSIAVAFSLIMGVTCANMFHAGMWQRVWAAESNEAVVTAGYAAGALSFVVMILVGVTGWIAYAQYGSNMILPGGFDISFLSAMCLIREFMGKGWAILTIIFGTAMIASTADTLQSGLTALLWPVAKYLAPNASNNVKMVGVILVMALLNVPCIILALSGQSILQLFLLADLLCATAVVPILLGLWDRTHPIATMVGMISGLATLLITYAIAEEWDEGFEQLVDKQGGIFLRSAAYAFCIVPASSGIITVLVSVVAFPNYRFEGYGAPAAGSTTKDATKDVQMVASSCA
jgi:Na+/proline symporter